MKIEILYLEGCRNYAPALERLRAVLHREGLLAEISEVVVKDGSAAKALKFIGSPTIRVDGLDIEPAARHVEDTGFACRRYPGGLPSDEMIRLALKEAQDRPKHP
jgi:hypothetical protein